MGGRRRSRKSIQSTVGNILAYKDIRSKRDIPYALEQIKKGPVTIVLIYADWCGHCHTYKPDYEKSINSPNCSVQRMSIQDEMVPHMNEALQKLNSNQTSIKVEGYPTVQLLDNKGTLIKDVPRESVPKVVDTAGHLATTADANAISQVNAANASNAADAANVIDKIPSAAKANAVEAANVETKPIVKAPIEPKVSSYTPFGTYLKGGLFGDLPSGVRDMDIHSIGKLRNPFNLYNPFKPHKLHKPLHKFYKRRKRHGFHSRRHGPHSRRHVSLHSRHYSRRHSR